MIQTRRLLAGAAAIVACALFASGCDTSPVAVSVNSQEIKQTQLNADLRAYSENKAFVTDYDGQQQSATSPAPVAGSAPGSYNAKFVASVLNSDIANLVLQQYLKAHGDLPGPGLLAATRAWEAAEYGPTWVGFPTSFRTELADHAANEAQFVTVPANSAALRQAVRQHANYLYSQVCVRQVGFSVNDANGQIDYPASLAAEKKAAAQGTLLKGGAVTCYTPVQLEGQGESFYRTILGLAVNRPTAPTKTAYGYQVYAVTQRSALPFDADLKRATALFFDDQSASPLERKILTAARVHLNPQYGTWSSTSGVTPSTPVASGS